MPHLLFSSTLQFPASEIQLEARSHGAWETQSAGGWQPAKPNRAGEAGRGGDPKGNSLRTSMKGVKLD